MHSHRLVRERDKHGRMWTLIWDQQHFRLTNPQGQMVFEADIQVAYRTLELGTLYIENRIVFVTPDEVLRFKKDPVVLADLRTLVDSQVAGDGKTMLNLRSHARWLLKTGASLFVVCGGLFALYCWYATWATDPPNAHWILLFSCFIRLALLICLALALSGPVIIWSGIRLGLRLRGIR